MTTLLSIVRYVPSPVRGEAANVGVLVVSTAPEGGYFRFLVESEGHVGRLRCLDPSFDADVISAASEWLEEYRRDFLEACEADGREPAEAIVAELFRFMSAGSVRLGVPESVLYGSPPSHAQLDELLSDTVESDVRWYKDVGRESSPRGADFKSRVRTILEDAHLYVPNSPTSPVRVDVSFPVRGAELKFDLGYDNGRPNLVEVADISNVHNENSIIEKAGATIAKFEILLESVSPGNEPGMVTLLSGGRQLARETSPSIRKLQTVSTVYFMDEDQERRQFVRTVREATSHGLL